jgi:hypothetical protein
MNTDVRTDPFSTPSIYLPSKPDLLAVHGEKATAAWRAWNAALDARCTHELTCFEGCQNTMHCCPTGAKLAWAEQQAYIDWDTLASQVGVPAEAAHVEVDDAPEDILLGMGEGLRISVILWGGIALVWLVFYVLSRGSR